MSLESSMIIVQQSPASNQLVKTCFFLSEYLFIANKPNATPPPPKNQPAQPPPPFSVRHIYKNNNIAAILTNTEDGNQLFPNQKIADDYTK